MIIVLTQGFPCYNGRMDSPDAGETTPGCCPTCASAAQVVCAASLAGNTAQPSGAHFLDIRLPGRVAWSGLWLCAAGCSVLGLVAWLLAPSTGWYQAAAVFIVFAVTFALLGRSQTCHNRRRMRGAEPLVHKVHARARYCQVCECVYFDSRKLPVGLPVGKAMSAAEYRRKLWYACGFTKPI
jgi:hypothetical protein